MLNELADLHRSLTEGGIELSACHPWIKRLKKAPALMLSVAEDGRVARVTQISADETVKERKIEKSNHASFPAFNLKCPLVTEQAGLAVDAALAQRLFSDGGPSAYTKSDIARVDRLLREFGVKFIGPIMRGRPGLESTNALIDRLATRAGDEQLRAFVGEIGSRVLEAVAAGDVEAEFGWAVLFGQWNKKSLSREEWGCTVLLEVADGENFARLVCDPATAKGWSDALLDWQAASAPETGIRCALTGRMDDPAGGKLPDPNLPLLGLTYLMSMNRDSPCQTRYGLVGTEVFQVGRRTAQQLNDALLYITDESRKLRTWASVPNGTRARSDLLVAYVDEEPDSDVRVVNLFSDEDLSPEEKAATFEARTASILATLTRQGGTLDLHVRVFALSALDKGRKQIVHSGKYTCKALIDGRNRWIEGARNLPVIRLPFYVGRGQKAEWRTPPCPSPSEAVYCFKQQWRQDGTSAGDIPGVELGRIYELYLGPHPQREAQWLIERLLPQVEGLLTGCGASRTTSARLKDPIKAEALKVVALIGILLLTQGIRKEQYMESREFLIGRFLQLADQLHKAYCEEQRDGSVPPQLIGNAAMAMAMERPARALEMLSARMAVYLAWSDRCEGEKAGLVRWFRKELGEVALKLREQDLSQRMSTNGRAEVLLGYLASTRKTEGEE